MTATVNPPTPEAVQERLGHWREVLLQVKAGVDKTTTRATARMALDHWLDRDIDRRGSAPMADVWDRAWEPSWPVRRMSRGIEDR
jgi:hypothetical protein